MIKEKEFLEKVNAEIFGLVKVKTREHPAWKEWEKIKIKLKPRVIPIRNQFGRWQYFYEKDGRKISLIQIRSYEDNLLWESGELMNNPEKSVEDVTQFNTKKQAEDYIFKKLGVKSIKDRYE